MTRHDILCPNAVKRDVGKTRCKSDVILRNCTLLRNLFSGTFIAQEAQMFYDFFRKEIFNYGLEDLYMRLFKYLSHNVRIGGVR